MSDNFKDNNFQADEVIMEDEQFSNQSSTLSIKTITLRQFDRCCVEGGKPMIQGGFEKRIVKNQEILVPIPNQREVFKNCVVMLQIVLKPAILARDVFKRDIELNEQRIKEITLSFEKERKEILSQAMISHVNHSNSKLSVSSTVSGNVDWEGILLESRDIYELKTVDIFQERLGILSLLLNELHYFDEVGVSA